MPLHIRTIKDGVKINGEERPRGYETRYPKFAAEALAAQGKVETFFPTGFEEKMDEIQAEQQEETTTKEATEIDRDVLLDQIQSLPWTDDEEADVASIRTISSRVEDQVDDEPEGRKREDYSEFLAAHLDVFSEVDHGV